MIRTILRGFSLIAIAGITGAVAALLVCQAAGVFELEELADRGGDLPTVIEILEESSE